VRLARSGGVEALSVEALGVERRPARGLAVSRRLGVEALGASRMIGRQASGCLS
jgi:hypothetical protein